MLSRLAAGEKWEARPVLRREEEVAGMMERKYSPEARQKGRGC